jgi:ribosomal protein S18 acetylase RimI-like enzyme
LRTGPTAQFAIAGDATGEAVATARCTTSGEWAGVTFMEVESSQRRRGIAAAMLGRLLDDAAEAGARQAWLQVETTNGAAQRLYARAGFVLHHRYVYRSPA